MIWLLLAVALAGYAVVGAAAWIAVRRARAAATFSQREGQARDIHDNVVQGLTQVNWALEAGAYDIARDAARAALADAQEMVGGLLESHPDGHAFGLLCRTGENGGREAELRIIGQSHGLVHLIEDRHGNDWAECFFAHQSH